MFTFGSLGFVGAFVCLGALFVTHQFQYFYVFSHSALDHELQYLIAGVWSGQEGSFLLWGLMSALAGVIAVRRTGPYRRWFTVVYGLFLAGVAAILAFESPFHLIPEFQGMLLIPPDGRGMSPSLLNYWVVIHPPTIFVGFGALTVLFAYAFAAVLQRNLVGWIPYVRPWAVFCLAVLGLGLCMGGLWAYETLGWGGFWMWDPVENTSFVPWCAVLAFVHGMFVQQARKKWFLANVVFGALPFVLFCYGTFLTRSGFLGDTSVHSFAEMNAVARWFLTGLGAASLVAFVTALVLNWKHIKPTLPASPPPSGRLLNRESFYGFGVMLFFLTAFATGLGMSIPIIQRALTGTPKVVEEQLYHQVLAWIFPPLMLAMAVAPFLSWNGLTLRELLGRITNCIAVTVGMIGVILLWMKSPGFHAPGPGDTINLGPFGNSQFVVTWVLFLTGLCLFVAVASFWRMMESLKRSKQTFAAMLAHFGLAVTLLGLVFSRGFEAKTPIIILHPSESPTAFGFALEQGEQTSVFSDRRNKIPITATGPNGKFVARPGLYYTVGQDEEPSPVVWPSVVSRGLLDYYFTIGEPIFEATDSTEFVLSADPSNPDTRAHGDVVLMYNGYEAIGSIAEDGVSMLIAKMTATTATETYEIKPARIISIEAGETPIEARIGNEYRVFLDRMDPTTHTVWIRLEYIQPAYPVEVMFKPLTLFVWLGIGIMTLGGLLAAALRRKENLDAS